MYVRQPTIDDIEQIIRLNSKYFYPYPSDVQIETGYLGKLYKAEELRQIIEEREIIIAADNKNLKGYYLIGRKEDKDSSVYLRNESLSLNDESGNPLSCIAYPTQVCIDEAYRNQGLFGKMLNALCFEIREKYKNILCSVSEKNIVSIKAHEKYGWEMINTFEGRKFFRLSIKY